MSLIAPAKRVENQGSPWLVSGNSAPFHATLVYVWTCPVFAAVSLPWTTCVMTVTVSTLLTGRFGRNCLYLNWLDNQPLAKRSFRKVVLADYCRGCRLAMPSISVTYCKCLTSRACQEGRKSGLSLIGFRKFRACPLIMATQVSLLRISVTESRSEMPVIYTIFFILTKSACK